MTIIAHYHSYYDNLRLTFSLFGCPLRGQRARKNPHPGAGAGAKKNPLAETSGRGSGRESPVNVWQFRTVAPCLALDAVLNPAPSLGAIIETAKGNSLAREPIDNNRDPLVAFIDENDSTHIKHIEHKNPSKDRREPQPPPV